MRLLSSVSRGAGLATALLCFLASTLSAQLFLYEDFSELEPGLIKGQGSADETWSGPWQAFLWEGPKIANDLPTGSQVTLTGKSLSAIGPWPDNGRAARELNEPIPMENYYVSYVLEPTEKGGSLQFILYDTTHETGPDEGGFGVQNQVGGFRIHTIGATADSPAIPNTVQILDSANPVTLGEEGWSGEGYRPLVEEAQLTATGEAHFLVMQVDTAGRTMDFWVFTPTDDWGDPNSATYTGTTMIDATRSASVNGLGIAKFGDTPALTAGIRIGASFRDVAPIPGPLAYEGFFYNPGQTIHGKRPGAHTGIFEWLTANGFTAEGVQGSLEYPSLQFAGNKVDAASGGISFWGVLNLDAAGPFAPFLRDDGMVGKDGTTLYMSYLFQLPEALNPQDQNFFALGSGDPLSTENAGLPTTAFDIGHKWGAEQFTAAGQPLGPLDNAIHLVVVEMTFAADTDTVNIYYDPIPGEPLAAQEVDATFTRADLFFDKVYYKGQNNTAYLDELRWGNTFDDVVPFREEVPTLEVTIVEPENGSIAVTPDTTVEVGRQVTFTATADEGYRFAEWTEGLAGVDDNPFTFRPSGDLTIGAVFEPIPTNPMATYTVDASVTYQTIEGFGTAISPGGTIGSGSVGDVLMRPDFLDFWFNEIGASVVRIEIRPNSLAEPVENWEDISYETMDFDHPGVKPWIDWVIAAKAVNPDLKVIGTVWSPPGWMKDNGQTRGTRPGFLADANRDWDDDNRLSDDKYLHMAKYLVEWSKYMESIGAPFFGIGPQNELMFTQAFNSCMYTPEEFARLVRELGLMFERENMARPLIFGNEDMTFFPSRHLPYYELLSAPGTGEYWDVVASHGYLDGVETDRDPESAERFYNLAVAPYDRPYWVTEGGTGSHEWPGALHDLGSMLYNTMVRGNASLWANWQAVESEPNTHAIMVFDNATKKTYAAMHWWRYIRPGAQRIDIQPLGDPIDIGAFQHPETGQTTFVAVNRQEAYQPITLQFAHDVDFAAMQIFRTSANEDFATLSPLAVTNNSVTFEMPPQSLVTLVNSEAPAGPQTIAEVDYDGADDLGMFALLGGQEASEFEDKLVTGAEEGYGFVQMDFSDVTASNWFFGFAQYPLGTLPDPDPSKYTLTVELAASIDGGAVDVFIQSSGEARRATGRLNLTTEMQTFSFNLADMEVTTDNPPDLTAEQVLLQFNLTGGFGAWPKGSVHQLRIGSFSLVYDPGDGSVTTYDLSVSAGDGGTVSSMGGTFDEGAEVTVTANADDGFAFAGWTGDIESMDNPLTLTMDQDYSITATFAAVPTAPENIVVTDFSAVDTYPWTAIGGAQNSDVELTSGVRDGYGFINLNAADSTSNWFFAFTQTAVGPLDADLSHYTMVLELAASTPDGRFRAYVRDDEQDRLEMTGTLDGEFQLFVANLADLTYVPHNNTDGAFDPGENILFQIDMIGGFNRWPRQATNELRIRYAAIIYNPTGERLEAGPQMRESFAGDPPPDFFHFAGSGGNGSVDYGASTYNGVAYMNLDSSASEAFWFGGMGLRNLSVMAPVPLSQVYLYAEVMGSDPGGRWALILANPGSGSPRPEIRLTGTFPDESPIFVPVGGSLADFEVVNPGFDPMQPFVAQLQYRGEIPTWGQDAGNVLYLNYLMLSWGPTVPSEMDDTVPGMVMHPVLGMVYRNDAAWHWSMRFGWIYTAGLPLIWTEVHGWQYAAGAYADDGLYLYDSRLGWLYTRADYDDWFYHVGTEQFIYHDGETSIPDRTFINAAGELVTEEDLLVEG